MARPTLSKHRKFRELSIILKSRALAWGSLELLWECAYDSGDPVIGSAAAVEAAADWKGKRGVLASALVSCQLLDLSEDGKTHSIHDLFDHMPDYVQKRMEREAERVLKGKTISDLRREAADKRWACKRDANEKHLHTDAMQTACKRDANDDTRALAPAPAPAPKENILPERKTSGDTMTKEFLTFYQAYPKHEDKRDAWKAWSALNGKRPPLSVLLEAIEHQKRGRKWQEGYIKSPASWLRKGCWEDETETSVNPEIKTRETPTKEFYESIKGLI